jgi:serine/threonine protein kinase
MGGPPYQAGSPIFVVGSDCGEYELGKKAIGSGTSGEVFLAKLTNYCVTGSKCGAIKRFHEMPSSLGSWLGETSPLEKLRVCGITMFHDLDSFVCTYPYGIVSDLLGDEVLWDIIPDRNQRHRLSSSKWTEPVDWIWRAFTAILRDLNVLDKAQFIAIDIKPEMCFTGNVFHIAADRDRLCNRDARLRNAPESSFWGSKLSAKVTIWSIGCPLFETYTRGRLFDFRIVGGFDYLYVRTLTNEAVRKRVQQGVCDHGRRLGYVEPDTAPELCEFATVLSRILDISPSNPIGPSQALEMVSSLTQSGLFMLEPADFDKICRNVAIHVQFFRAYRWQIVRESALPSADALGRIRQNSVEHQ